MALAFNTTVMTQQFASVNVFDPTIGAGFQLNLGCLIYDV